MRAPWIVASVACALALSTAACGSNPKTSKSSTVTISYWVNWTGAEAHYLNQVLAGFERTHPKIKVKVSPGVGGDTTHLLPAIAGGNAPDLVSMWDLGGISKLCASGQLTNLGNRIAAAGITDQTYVAPTAAFMKSSIHGCGIPQLGDANGLYYNKSMFAAAHISSPRGHSVSSRQTRRSSRRTTQTDRSRSPGSSR